MEATVKTDKRVFDQQDRTYVLDMLDRCIDDMEIGRELPLDKAFEKVTELRDKRRYERAQM